MCTEDSPCPAEIILGNIRRYLPVLSLFDTEMAQAVAIHPCGRPIPVAVVHPVVRAKYLMPEIDWSHTRHEIIFITSQRAGDVTKNHRKKVASTQLASELGTNMGAHPACDFDPIPCREHLSAHLPFVRGKPLTGVHPRFWGVVG